MLFAFCICWLVATWILTASTPDVDNQFTLGNLFCWLMSILTAVGALDNESHDIGASVRAWRQRRMSLMLERPKSVPTCRCLAR